MRREEKAILQGLLARLGAGSRRLEAVRAAWLQVADDVAGETRVVSFRKGVVTVEVATSARLMELAAFRCEALCRALREAGLDVRSLRFRLAGTLDGESNC